MFVMYNYTYSMKKILFNFLDMDSHFLNTKSARSGNTVHIISNSDIIVYVQKSSTRSPYMTLPIIELWICY